MNALKHPAFGGFPGKVLLPIQAPFSSCKMGGGFTFRCYFAGSSISKPLLVEVERYKRCKTPLNYSRGVSIEAPQWDKGKDLVTQPRPWDVSLPLFGWKNPSCIYWGEGSRGEDETEGFPPSRRAGGRGNMWSTRSLGASNQSNPVEFALWQHRSFSKLLQDQRSKIKVGHRKRNCKP